MQPWKMFIRSASVVTVLTAGAFAAGQANLFVASGWSDDETEDLFATPIASASEVQRLIDTAEQVLVIPDAHKMMVELR